MAKKLSYSFKRWRNRFVLAVAFSPALMLANELFYSTSASAEELTTPNEEGGTSDSSSTTEPITDENASEEVVLEAPSPESTQGSIDEAATAVATAESEIANVEQEIQETKNLKATIESTEETTQAIAEAEEAAVSATVARDSASSAIEEASIALGEWETAIHESDTADANLVIAEEVATIEQDEHLEAVANRQNQEVIFNKAFEEKTLAETNLIVAEEEVSEVVVETFVDAGGNFTTSSTDIQILKDGQPVTQTEVDQTSITDQYTNHLDGTTLQLQNTTRDTVIDFPNVKQISEIGMSVYAKNGDTIATVNIFDSEGTTAQDSWMIEDNVSSYPEGNPEYTTYEVYKTPDGYYVDNVVLPPDSDWYIVDDIYYKQVTGEVDPALYEAVETTTATYKAEEVVLQDLITTEVQKFDDYVVATDNAIQAKQVATDAELLEQSKAGEAESAVLLMNESVSAMNEAISKAQYISTLANTIVEQEVVNQTPEPQPISPPVYVPPQPTPEPEPEVEQEPEIDTEEDVPLEDSEDVEEETAPEEPQPEETVEPEPEPEPQPTPEPEPTPEPLPSPSDDTPEQEETEQPQPEEPTEPEVLQESEAEESQTPSETPSALNNPDSSIEEKVEAIIETLETGTSVKAQVLFDNGITFDDLPPETPVSVREDEDGNEVVIDAKTAAALLVLEDPTELVRTVFENPEKAVEAAMSIGKDMSEEEREESQKVVVAAVIVGNIANLAVQAASNAAVATLPGTGRRRP